MSTSAMAQCDMWLQAESQLIDSSVWISPANLRSEFLFRKHFSLTECKCGRKEITGKWASLCWLVISIPIWSLSGFKLINRAQEEILIIQTLLAVIYILHWRKLTLWFIALKISTSLAGKVGVWRMKLGWQHIFYGKKYDTFHSRKLAENGYLATFLCHELFFEAKKLWRKLGNLNLRHLLLPNAAISWKACSHFLPLVIVKSVILSFQFHKLLSLVSWNH